MNNSIKRILIFSLTYHPFVGGAEIAVKEITDRITDIEFDMITLRVNKNLPACEKIGNIRIYRIGFAKKWRNEDAERIFPSALDKYLFPFLAFFKALSLNRRSNYDAVWAIMANYAGFAALLFKIFKRNVRYILTLQEGDPIQYIKHRVRFILPFFKKVFTKADIIQTISHYLKKFAEDMGYAGKIIVVPNGVDIAHFSRNYSDYDIKRLGKQLGKKDYFEDSGSRFAVHGEREGDILLVTTSRLVKKNGVGDIITSLNFLPKNIKLLVIGSGPDLNVLKNMADDVGIAGRVKFLGYIDHDIIPLYLRVSNIFVRPSLSEGFGNSFVEAMAAGLPVIATPVGGIVDFLVNKETGIFCKPSDPKDLADKVRILLEDDDMRKKLIKNAKKIVTERYDWNIIARYMEEKVFKP